MSKDAAKMEYRSGIVGTSLGRVGGAGYVWGEEGEAHRSDARVVSRADGDD